jgi:hypothetical protein
MLQGYSTAQGLHAEILTDRVAQRLETVAVGHQFGFVAWERLPLSDEVAKVSQALEHFVRSPNHRLGGNKDDLLAALRDPAERNAPRAAVFRSVPAACSPRETARIVSLAWCKAVR